MFGYLMLGTAYAFAAAVQPGPLQAYLISQSLAHGWRRTVLASFAPVISDGPIIALIVFILIQMPGWLAPVLQCAGAIFLLYLAFGAWKTWRSYDAQKQSVAPSRHQTLLKAVVINLLNPNPYLGWSLVMGPLLLQGWRESPSHGIALLLGFYGTIVLSSIGIVALFSSARNLGPRINRKLIGISIVALAGFGIYLLWQGISPYW
jgi:threonine/homoserine/homoserine lactone efflux protein